MVLKLLACFASSLAFCLAASDAAKQVEQREADFQTNFRTGEQYIQKHQLQTAVIYLRKAFAQNPAELTNAYDLALADLELGKLADCRVVITTVLQTTDRAEFHNLLGDLEEKEGYIQEAAKQYETAARLEASEKNVFDLASDLLKHNDYRPALQVFLWAKGRYPASAKLRVGLGVTEYSMGSYHEAVQSLCEAVDLDPADTRALSFLGKMINVSPDLAEEVTRRLKQFADAYPRNAAANYYYALSLRKRNAAVANQRENADAEKLFQKTIALEPAFADAHFQLGLLYEDESRYGEAIAQYAAAERLTPAEKTVHYRLAQLYARTGQKQLAQQEFNRVKDLSSSKEN